MGVQPRLNILLTHDQAAASRSVQSPHPWYELLSHLLTPLGVQTFEATSNDKAMQLIEAHPIHLAVVDTRLTASDGLGLLRILQKIRQRAQADDYLASVRSPAADAPPNPIAHSQPLRVPVDFGPQGAPAAAEPVAVKVNPGQPKPPNPKNPNTVWPTVILVTPILQDQLILQEALKCNAFSVLAEPVDVNIMLEIMARAMKRFHQNQWPL